MTSLALEQLLEIHVLLVEATGGGTGLCDLHWRPIKIQNYLL